METETAVISGAAFVPSQLIASCDGDLDLAIEVLQDFRKSNPGRVDRLEAAAKRNDSSDVRLEAHSIKGSSRTIGAEFLASAAARVEASALCSVIDEALISEIVKQAQVLDEDIITYISKSTEALAMG